MGDTANLIRTIVTVMGIVCFLAIVFWAYSRAPKQRFDEASHLPFADDASDRPQQAPSSQTAGSLGAKQ